MSESSEEPIRPSLDREKARRAAKDPARPGEKCGAAPGTWRPVVDRGKCEGKHDCVDVCPYSVFEVRRMDDTEYLALGFWARLKSSVHGRKTAYTPRAEACQACGLCVVACPENAIQLVKLAVDGAPVKPGLEVTAGSGR